MKPQLLSVNMDPAYVCLKVLLGMLNNATFVFEDMVVKILHMEKPQNE